MWRMHLEGLVIASPTDRIAILILNYRTADLVHACVASLDRHGLLTPDRSQLFIVDNHSEDGSHESFVAAYGDRKEIEVIASGVNGGYGAGNNVVLRRLLASDAFETVLLLNPDTELRTPIPDKVFELLSDPKVAAVGARLEDRDTTVQKSAFRFPSPAGEFVQSANFSWVDRVLGEHRVACPLPTECAVVDWLAGAAVFFKLAALREVGLFDEKFFLYFEEVDLFRRLDQAGWKSCYLPAMQLIHHVGASTQISDGRTRTTEMPQYWYESRSRYFAKEWGRFGSLWPDACWLAGRLVHRIVRGLSGREADGSVRTGNVMKHNAFLASLRLGRVVDVDAEESGA